MGRGLQSFLVRRLSSIAAVMVGALVVSDARAAQLVYEGFRASTQAGDGGYPTASFWVNDTFAPNAFTLGLNKTVNYGLNNSSAWQINADSLPFSSAFLPTLAGSLQTPNGGTVIAGAQLSMPGPHVGTLYHSHLARFTGHASPDSGNGMQVRITTSITGASSRFIAEADTRSGSSQAAGVAYTGTVTTGGAVLASNTTYLIIARYTNVGTALSAGNPGVGTLYALTAPQYDSFVAAGATESYLDNTSLGVADTLISSRLTSSAVTSGTIVFDNTLFAQWVNLVPTTVSTSFDEMRYGSTLADVAGVPEPAGFGVVAMGILGLLRRRARRTLL